ncbi:tetratricopeptide repeat protein [Motiliproteus sediminis]|uniref:tetratricopeptide repeat protein n=1 Tax=Motiliproteus sediminis TaxID=1468178 RepID=UPI001AEF4D18|nr:tetratricopeptide repeat protein [Motiliproteus sediminis]
MSLVNDMLRDLDQRREKPSPGREIPLTASASASPATQTRWIGLGGASLVTAAVVTWLLLNPEPASSPATAAPERPPVSSESTPVVAQPLQLPAVQLPAVVAPVEVSAVRWQRAGNDWLLTLVAGAETPYNLRKIDGRELQLSLPDVLLSAPLPALPDRLIQSLSLESSDGGLELHLTSREPVNFQVHPLQNDSGYQLQVRVETRPQPASATTIQEHSATAAANSLRPSAVPPAAKSAADSTAQVTVEAAKPAAPLPVAPLQKSVRVSAEQRDQQHSSDALALVRKGRTRAAIANLRAFVSDDSAALQSRTLLATLLLAEQQSVEAAQVIDTGLALTPQDPGLRKLKARLLILAGDSGQAAELLRDAAPAVARDSEYHQLKAAAEQAAGLHQAASRSYHGLLQHDATNPAWWVGLGISLEALQQKAQARQAYANVLQIPRVPASLSGYARTRLQQLGG